MKKILDRLHKKVRIVNNFEISKVYSKIHGLFYGLTNSRYSHMSGHPAFCSQQWLELEENPKEPWLPSNSAD